MHAHKSIATAASLAIMLGLGATAAAQSGSQLFLVDFEEFEEETAISDQYLDLGVTFSLPDVPGGYPIIAVEGNPVVAFDGSGPDTPMSSGSGGLTDPVVGGDVAVGADIGMTFDPPVTSVRLFVIDIDASDVMTLRAYDGETEVDSMTKSAGQSGTGNGVSTEFFVSGENITSVVIEVPESTGYAVDYVLFARPCEGSACGPQVRIAQESAPGAGDFDDHILGNLAVFPAAASAFQFYAYGVPEGSSWNGPLTPIADRSHLLMANTNDGMTLIIVHDRAIPDDPDGGNAEMTFEITSDDDGAVRTVEDDPGDFYTGEAGDSLFTAANAWSPCCTDGLAISGLDCQSITFVQFTEVDGSGGTAPIEGLTEWVAYSADGTEFPLALEVERRVRLEVVPHPDCPADLNCDGVVDIIDLLLVLGNWGPCGAVCFADVDENGAVDVLDLLAVLAQWGQCP